MNSLENLYDKAKKYGLKVAFFATATAFVLSACDKKEIEPNRRNPISSLKINNTLDSLEITGDGAALAQYIRVALAAPFHHDIDLEALKNSTDTSITIAIRPLSSNPGSVIVSVRRADGSEADYPTIVGKK